MLFKNKNGKRAQKSKIKASYRYLYLVLGLFIFTTSGCAQLKEMGRGMAGLSIKALEEKRTGALKKIFECGYDECFNNTEKILIDGGSYVYCKKKDMIAVYVSDEDTTPVGVFFTALDRKQVQIEVSSLSTYAKELIAKRVFLGLEKIAKDGKDS